MRPNGRQLLVMGLALCAMVMAARGQLRTIPLGGTASKLSSVVYFKPPNEQQVQLRLSGAEMSPLPGAMFDVKQLTVEEYTVAGKLQAVVEAPQCIYAPWDGVASSPGHLQLRLQEDRIHVEGDGFVWRQNDNSLVISNHVSTIIKTGTWSLITP